MNDVRIGVLGVGRIGRMHAELIHRQTEGARVSAVYDLATEAASAVGTELGARIAGSPDDLITADDVDAVAICSSTDTHIDLLIAAAEAGKPVFIEKPLSLDLATVDRGLEAVAASGIEVQVGFNRRFDASHKLVRDQVLAGAVGDVHMVRITSRDPAPPPIAYIKVSGGIFLDMTIHDFDMARYVTGSEVSEVFAVGAVRVDPDIGAAGDLDTAVIVLTHENGVIPTIATSRHAVYGSDQRVEAFGSRAMVASDNPVTTTTRLHSAEGSVASTIPYFFLDRYIPSYLAEWADFVTVVRDGVPSPVTLADGRAPLVMGLAAAMSVAEGRPVRTDEIG